MTERPSTQPDPFRHPDDPQWVGWGRPGRCLPVDAEAVGSYECHHCGRPITEGMDTETPCPGRAKGAQ